MSTRTAVRVAMATLILYALIAGSCQKCDNPFHNTDARIVPRSGKPLRMRISGCIERVTFPEDVSAAEIEIRDQRVRSLYEDSVKHLVRLTVFTMFNCSTERIETGAFRNVPRLQAVALLHSSIRSLPETVFLQAPLLETLRLGHNELRNISSNAFSNLPSLKKFYANDNRLESLNPHWFLENTQLTELDFQGNRLSALPRNAFKNLRNLTRLYLGNNAIERIEEGAFTGVKELKYLGLRYNLLKSLEPSSFPRGMRVEWLLVDANRLNYLSSEVLRKAAVRDVTLQGNPWKCICLKDLLNWAYAHNVSVLDSPQCQGSSIPVCVEPLTSPGTCLEEVDEEATATFRSLIDDFVTTEGIQDFYSRQCVRVD